MNWTLTKKDTNEQLALHSQFHWSDEYDWTPIAQSDPVYTITGAMIIEQGTKKAGRPMTLSGANVWIPRHLLATLQAWASEPKLIMRLGVPDGRSFDVVFNRPAISDIEAVKSYRHADRQDDDHFRATLNFLTV